MKTKFICLRLLYVFFKISDRVLTSDYDDLDLALKNANSSRCTTVIRTSMDIRPQVCMNIFTTDGQTDRQTIITDDLCRQRTKHIRLACKIDQQDPVENYQSQNNRLPTPDLLCSAFPPRLTEIHKRLYHSPSAKAGVRTAAMGAEHERRLGVHSYINDALSLIHI